MKDKTIRQHRSHSMLKRFSAMFLAIVLLVTMAPQTFLKSVRDLSHAQAATTPNVPVILRNPTIEGDDSLHAGQKVTYLCVYFGSYPQTEIVSRPELAGTNNKLWTSSTDYEVNSKLYISLKKASYTDQGYTIIDGVKYQRVGKDDTSYSTVDDKNYYDWKAEDTYHYFRYDPIKWRVLNVKDGNAELLADLALDCKPYHMMEDSVSWEESTLRSWLNGYGAAQNKVGINYTNNGFATLAFTAVQKAVIRDTALMNNDNVGTAQDGGNDTTDKVYLLSSSDLTKNGFVADINTFDEAKRARTSPYAKAMGAFSSTVSSLLGCTYSWTRSPATHDKYICRINIDGNVSRLGSLVDRADNAVRPVITINTAATNVWKAAGTVTSLYEASVPEAPVSNPVISPAYGFSAEQKVTYDCVWFGSYPQTEIVSKAQDSGIYGNAYWGNANGYEVSSYVYSALRDVVTWDSKGETVFMGKRYIRISEDDASYVGASSSPNYYKWSNAPDNRYHYFRYDPIKWRVLSVDEDGYALLHSDLILDARPYHTDFESITWENSYIRSWLNTTFLNRAFTSEQANVIRNTRLINNANFTTGISGGNDTTDEIFLLSESDVYAAKAKEYGFVTKADTFDEAKRRQSSTFAKAMGLYSDTVDGERFWGDAIWWLRSPGKNQSYAANVAERGSVHSNGEDIMIGDQGVCPAVTLNLRFSDLYSYAGTISTDGKSTEVRDPSSVSLDKSSLKLLPGESATLKATVLPENARDKAVTWTSENPSIATVSSDGIVKAIKAGTVKIVAKTDNDKKADCLVSVGFTDVPRSAWYFNPVMFALEYHITSGTGDGTKFSPELVCTRAQIVTFLWNAEGRPSVSGVSNPFKDVKSTDWYYSAVLWAVNKGITHGTTATTFSPNENCTRAQIVTFLWNYMGQPKTTKEVTFSDVPKTAYYYSAVRWAVENKVTNGTNGGKTFSPDDHCTRAQAVTFLYNFNNAMSE